MATWWRTPSANGSRWRAPAAKLLALTGYGRDEDRRAALKAGFDGHLAKPVDPARLLDIVATQDEPELRCVGGDS